MAKTEVKKGKRLVKKSAIDSSPKIKKKKLITKKKKQSKKVISSSSSGSESDSDPQTTIQSILEPFPKEQLINLVADLCSSNSSLYSLFKSAADADVSHRKLFIHGLGWDATKDAVEEVFSSFGKIEDINVVPDRATGKCKGYAFITYESRKSANNLLKNPRVTVGNRVVACQLASEGPAAPGAAAASQKTVNATNSNANTTDFHQRKIYVNNVHYNVEPGRLRSFFESFGEIENGPTGLDPNTGRFRGYAIFVFKTVEGARKVLEEPMKVFDGVQLHCQKAAQGKSKGGNASITTAMQPLQPHMLSAVAAAQSMALLGQQAAVVNPLYGNLGALMGGYYGMMGQGFGLGGYGGVGGGASDGAGGSSGAAPQGLQYMYPSSLNGQSSPLPKTSGAGGSGYFPGLWYDLHNLDE